MEREFSFIQTQHFILTITIKSWANSTYKERVFLFTFDRLSWRPLGNIKLISKNKERFQWLRATKVDEGQGESGDYQTELSQGQPEEIQSSLMSHHSLPKSNIPRPIEAFIKKVKRNIQSLVYTKPGTERKNTFFSVNNRFLQIGIIIHTRYGLVPARSRLINDDITIETTRNVFSLNPQDSPNDHMSMGIPYLAPRITSGAL